MVGGGGGEEVSSRSSSSTEITFCPGGTPPLVGVACLAWSEGRGISGELQIDSNFDACVTMAITTTQTPVKPD